MIDGSTQTDHDISANGAFIELLGDQITITLDSQGINQNSGDVDYSFAILPSSYPATLTKKNNGIVELNLTLPETRETVGLSIVAADSLGRPDINVVPDKKAYSSVQFDVRKKRSQPALILLTHTIEIIDNQYLQARFNLNDPDKDFNDIVMHYSVDNSPYLTALSVQGETRVQEGNNYTIRWYFKTDGSFYIDNRQNVTIKLNADDGSYHDPVDSNTHTMNFEVDTPWSDYTGGYLSVENVLELTNSTFLETEPNGIQRDVQPLIRAKVGDSFQLQGKVSYLTDIRDSFRFEVEGTASLNVSWIEGDLQYRPELGVYDVHAAKFIYFDWESLDEISNVILNAHGGLREYELVLFHPSENGGEYKLEVEVNDLELGRIQKIRELEPNNTAFDAQYLGNLSRSLSYDLNGKGGDSKGSDFYEFDIFGVYPMQFSLYPYITNDEVELV